MSEAFVQNEILSQSVSILEIHLPIFILVHYLELIKYSYKIHLRKKVLKIGKVYIIYKHYIEDVQGK